MLGGFYPGQLAPGQVAQYGVELEVVFGEATGTTAGELFTIPYTSETELVFAELILPDGRRIELTISPSMMQVLLPPDTPSGYAAIYVEDEFDQSGTFPNVALLTGAVAFEGNGVRSGGTPTPTGVDHPSRRPLPRTRLRVRSRTVIRQQVGTHSRQPIVSSTRLAAKTPSRSSLRFTSALAAQHSTVTMRSQVTVTARSQQRAHLGHATKLAIASSTTRRWRDGPELEALLLGLL